MTSLCVRGVDASMTRIARGSIPQKADLAQQQGDRVVGVTWGITRWLAFAGIAVLFGGVDAVDVASDETWIWNGRSWRRPPLLVTADTVRAMKSGSVIVDMAASTLGGNVELSVPDDTIVTENGVTIIAPTNLPATMPGGASGFYARNISALLTHFIKEGEMTFDFEDEITALTEGEFEVSFPAELQRTADWTLEGVRAASMTTLARSTPALPSASRTVIRIVPRPSRGSTIRAPVIATGKKSRLWPDTRWDCRPVL